MSESKQDASARAYPGSLESGWLVAKLFFRVTLGRRRILWLGLVLLVPLALTLYFRIAEGGSGLAFFEQMTRAVFLQLFALGLPLYLGVSAIRDEIDDKTIVYLFARPIRRSVIVGGKVLAVALVVACALAADLALVFLLSVSADGAGTLGLGLFRLLQGAGVLALAAFAYTAFFALCGVLLRKPMLVAMAIGLGWELTVSNLPGAFPRLTLMFYLKSLLGAGPEVSGFLSFLIPVTQTASLVESLAVVVFCTLAFFAAALLLGSSKEYRV